MIDIETLSTQNNAIILTIGAIKFNRHDDVLLLKKMPTFYERIDIQSCKNIGLISDESTSQWWKNQEDDIRYEALENPDRIPIHNALRKLSIFLRNCKYIWCQGINFDPVILENAYTRCKIPLPWKYYILRDTRTLYDITNVNLKDFCHTDGKHNSLKDCYYQVNALKKSFKKMSLNF